MFSTRLASFCIQRSPVRRFQTSTSHYFPLNKIKHRRAKWNVKYRHNSGNDWNNYDLLSYNISIERVNPLQFFGLQTLPEPAVDQELLNSTDAGAMQQPLHAQLIHLLDLAMTPRLGDTGVCDFSAKLLEVVGYVGHGRVARTRMDLPLSIDKEEEPEGLVKADVCIVDRRCRDDILLVLKEESHPIESLESTRARLVAQGLAAFNENQYNRYTNSLPPLEEQVIPGIIMIGTLPTFFKIPVTQSLVKHIDRGAHLAKKTQVTYCSPFIPADRRLEGMKSLDNRREIMKCFEAFKAIELIFGDLKRAECTRRKWYYASYRLAQVWQRRYQLCQNTEILDALSAIESCRLVLHAIDSVLYHVI